jgi:hypothetical protein
MGRGRLGWGIWTWRGVGKWLCFEMMMNKRVGEYGVFVFWSWYGRKIIECISQWGTTGWMGVLEHVKIPWICTY